MNCSMEDSTGVFFRDLRKEERPGVAVVEGMVETGRLWPQLAKVARSTATGYVSVLRGAVQLVGRQADSVGAAGGAVCPRCCASPS